MLSQKEVSDYALEARDVRKRRDVYRACCDLLRDWNALSGDEERRFVFHKIRFDSVGDTRLPVNSVQRENRTYWGWRKERTKGTDAVTDAYLANL